MGDSRIAHTPRGLDATPSSWMEEGLINLLERREPPVLQGVHIDLRPMRRRDARAICRLAEDRDIAANTLMIPHPYRLEDARQWIRDQAGMYREGTRVDYVIVLRGVGEPEGAKGSGVVEGAIGSGELVGAIGIGIDRDHRRADLGYWVGRPYQGKGYATEAATTLLAYCFGVLELNRVFASTFARNPASGRVLEKAGMSREGCLRQHCHKWGRFEDVIMYGIVRSERLSE